MNRKNTQVSCTDVWINLDVIWEKKTLGRRPMKQKQFFRKVLEMALSTRENSSHSTYEAVLQVP